MAQDRTRQTKHSHYEWQTSLFLAKILFYYRRKAFFFFPFGEHIQIPWINWESNFEFKARNFVDKWASIPKQTTPVNFLLLQLGPSEQRWNETKDLPLLKHHTVKVYTGNGGKAPHICLDTGCRWLDSRSGDFTPGEKLASTHRTGDWLGFIDGLGLVAKMIIPTLTRNLTLVIQPVISKFSVSELKQALPSITPGLSKRVLHMCFSISGSYVRATALAERSWLHFIWRILNYVN